LIAHASRSRSDLPRYLVWFGIFAAPAAWAAQELLGWFVEGLACGASGALLSRTVISQPVARAAEWTIALVAALVALGALAVGISLWRRSGDPRLTRLQVQGVADFEAATAVLVSTVFFLAIVWAGLPPALLRMCASVR
jgi:hypothetical protein